MLSPTSNSPYRKSIKRGASFVKLTERADRVVLTAKPSTKSNYKNVSKSELIRYVIYTVVFFVILSLQIDMKETFLQSNSIRLTHYPKSDIQKITSPWQYYSKNILDVLVKNHFIDEGFGNPNHTFVIPRKTKAISDIRIRTNKLKSVNETENDLWAKYFGDDKSEYGKNESQKYKFNEKSRKLL